MLWRKIPKKAAELFAHSCELGDTTACQTTGTWVWACSALKRLNPPLVEKNAATKIPTKGTQTM